MCQSLPIWKCQLWRAWWMWGTYSQKTNTEQSCSLWHTSLSEGKTSEVHSKGNIWCPSSWIEKGGGGQPGKEEGPSIYCRAELLLRLDQFNVFWKGLVSWEGAEGRYVCQACPYSHPVLVTDRHSGNQQSYHHRHSPPPCLQPLPQQCVLEVWPVFPWVDGPYPLIWEMRCRLSFCSCPFSS